MTFRPKCLLLLVMLLLAGCATIPKPAVVKSGAYYFVWMGSENVLTLTADGQFHYLYTKAENEDGKPYSYESHGTYSIDGQDLRLEYETPDGGHKRADGPMWIVWWGTRCYLVQPWRSVEWTTSAVTHRWPKKNGGKEIPAELWEPRKTREGWMYLHDGDWLLPVTGKPELPKLKKAGV